MRRNYWVVVANVLVLAVLVGCRENGVSPVAAPSAAPASMSLAPTGRPSLSLTGGASGDVSTDFTVGPSGGVFFVGNHAVVFPARSICDPATSTYGSDTWDDACQVLTRPIAIHAVVRTQAGRSWVDFSPNLRFRPSNDPARWVWMFMYTPRSVGVTGDLSQFNILYAESIGGLTVDDAAGDPTLRTYVDTRSGLSFRRIKHFSGYTASSGYTCDATVPGDCTNTGNTGDGATSSSPGGI